MPDSTAICLYRDPIQKLSKPVPTTGLSARLRAACQTAVRPVSVESLPIVANMLEPMLSKRAETTTPKAPSTMMCTSAGFRKPEYRKVKTIGTPARKKEAKAVADCDPTNKYIAITVTTP